MFKESQRFDRMPERCTRQASIGNDKQWFQLTWMPPSISKTDLRLRDGDVIALTSFRPNGFFGCGRVRVGVGVRGSMVRVASSGCDSVRAHVLPTERLRRLRATRGQGQGRDQSLDGAGRGEEILRTRHKCRPNQWSRVQTTGRSCDR